MADDASEVKLDVDQFEDRGEVPDDIVELISDTPFIRGPNETDEEMHIIETGRCPCCRRPLGSRTLLLIDDSGIQAIACSSPCLDDLTILGFLHETSADILGNIHMRHNVTGGHD